MIATDLALQIYDYTHVPCGKKHRHDIDGFHQKVYYEYDLTFLLGKISELVTPQRALRLIEDKASETGGSQVDAAALVYIAQLKMMEAIHA